MKSITSIAVAAVLFSACSQLSTVKNVTPVPPAAASLSGTSLPSEKEESRDPEEALAGDLNVAAKAWAELRRNPQDSQAIQLYNYSVARVVSLVQATGRLPQAGAVTIGRGPRSYRLTF